MDKYDNLSYTLEATCSNCDWRGSVTITKGYTLGQRSCPNCGCATLHKERRPML